MERIDHLLTRARDAGLDVFLDGDRLVIQGPKEANSVAREVLARKAEVKFFLDSDADDWPANAIDPDELAPCERCGGLEQWQSAAGDLQGLSPGVWRCCKCDPPALARRVAAAVERIRGKH